MIRNVFVAILQRTVGIHTLYSYCVMLCKSNQFFVVLLHCFNLLNLIIVLTTMFLISCFENPQSARQIVCQCILILMTSLVLLRHFTDYLVKYKKAWRIIIASCYKRLIISLTKLLMLYNV